MKSLNKVDVRKKLTQNARIAHASEVMLREVRYINNALYLAALIPMVLVFIVPAKYSYACSAVSLFINILTIVTNSVMNNHKEKAILVLQLFESNISNTVYSRTEYDRESTNEAYEYSVRKSKNKLPQMGDDYYFVPHNIEERYSYLYIQRTAVAEFRFLLAKYRIFLAVMMFVMAAAATTLITILNVMFSQDLTQLIPQIVCVYPVIVPIIVAFTEAGMSAKRAVKISADIDNFFADHDKSNARLDRVNYYFQNLVYEFRAKLRPIPFFFKTIFRKGLLRMRLGVSERFIQAIYDLEGITNLGKMKNAAFIDAEIESVDPITHFIDTSTKKTYTTQIESDHKQVNIRIYKKRARPASDSMGKQNPVISKAESLISKPKEITGPALNATSTTKSQTTNLPKKISKPVTLKTKTTEVVNKNTSKSQTSPTEKSTNQTSLNNISTNKNNQKKSSLSKDNQKTAEPTKNEQKATKVAPTITKTSDKKVSTK